MLDEPLRYFSWDHFIQCVSGNNPGHNQLLRFSSFFWQIWHLYHRRSPCGEVLACVVTGLKIVQTFRLTDLEQLPVERWKRCTSVTPSPTALTRYLRDPDRHENVSRSFVNCSSSWAYSLRVFIPQPVELPIRNDGTKQSAILRISNAGFAIIFEIYLAEERIAYANCSPLNRRALMVHDLRVGDEITVRKRRWFEFAKHPPEYRRRGWGTLLLAAVIEEAKRTEYSVVVVEVTPADRTANDDLLGWYSRNGFFPSAQGASHVGWVRLQRDL